MSSIFLEVNNLSKTYIKRWTRTSLARCVKNLSFKSSYNNALTDTSFYLNSGQILAIEGPNGSGKSTLLRIVADRLAPSSGKIIRHGTIVPIISLGACMHSLVSVERNVRHAYVMLSGSYPNPHTVLSILELAGLTEKANDTLQTLSFGMLAKLTLSIGLNIKADIYLIDELLDPIDKQTRSLFINKVRDLASKGASVIFVSHDTDIVRQLSTSSLVLNN